MDTRTILVQTFGFKAQSDSFIIAFSCLCLSGPCPTVFSYDHNVTYLLHIAHAEKAVEQDCQWQTKSESVLCEVLLIALAA